MEFNKLSKDNFFYDLVSSFAFSVHGLNDIFARSFILRAKSEISNDDQFNILVDRMNFSEFVKLEVKKFKTFTPSIISPDFERKYCEESIYFDVNKVALNTPPEKHVEIYKQIISMAESTIIVGFEKIMTKNLLDSKEKQFFRHIRNASAHNGKFHFDKKVLNKNGELKKEAQWSSFIIKSDLQGQKMFSISKSSRDNFWDLGDLIDFLFEFESYYPELKQHMT